VENVFIAFRAYKFLQEALQLIVIKPHPFCIFEDKGRVNYDLLGPLIPEDVEE
jgi:hypothetical protein